MTSTFEKQPGSQWLAENRTRPCPFYSSGNCIFADSCSFLHIMPPSSAPPTRLPAMNDLLYQLRDVLPAEEGPHVPSPPVLKDSPSDLDLLSPVSSSSLALTGFHHIDDSGFVDTTGWKPDPPQPPFLARPMTPPKSPLTTPKSTLDLVSSPFGSPSLRVSSPTVRASNDASGQISPLEAAFPSPILKPAASPQPAPLNMDELESPTDYHAFKQAELAATWNEDDEENGGHTAVFLGSPGIIPETPSSDAAAEEQHLAYEDDESSPHVSIVSPPAVYTIEDEDYDPDDMYPPREPSPFLNGVDDPFAREPSPFLDGVTDPFARDPSPFFDDTESSDAFVSGHSPNKGIYSLSRDPSPIPEAIPEEDEEGLSWNEDEVITSANQSLEDPERSDDEDSLAEKDEEDESFHCADLKRASLPPSRPSSSLSLSTERAEGASSPSPSIPADEGDTFGFGPSKDARTQSPPRSETPTRPRPTTPLYEDAHEEEEINARFSSYEFMSQDPIHYSRSRSPSIRYSGSRRRSLSRSSSRCSTPTPLPDLLEEDESNTTVDISVVEPTQHADLEEDAPDKGHDDEAEVAPSADDDDDSTAHLAYMFTPPGLSLDSPERDSGLEEATVRSPLPPSYENASDAFSEQSADDATVSSVSSTSSSESGGDQTGDYRTALSGPLEEDPVSPSTLGPSPSSPGSELVTADALSERSLTPTPGPVSVSEHEREGPHDGETSFESTMMSIGGSSLSTINPPDAVALDSSMSSIDWSGDSISASTSFGARQNHDASFTSSTLFSAGEASFSSSDGQLEDDEEICVPVRREEPDETLHALYDVYSSASDSEHGDDIEQESERRFSSASQKSLRKSIFSPPEAMGRVFTPPPPGSANTTFVPPIDTLPHPRVFTPEPFDQRTPNSTSHSGEEVLHDSPSPRSRASFSSSRTSSRLGFYSPVSPATPTPDSTSASEPQGKVVPVGSRSQRVQQQHHNQASSASPRSPSGSTSSPVSTRGRGLKPLRLSLSLVDPNASASSVLDFPLPPAASEDSTPSRSGSVSSARPQSVNSIGPTSPRSKPISRDSLQSNSSVPVSSASTSSPVSRTSSISLSSNAFGFALPSNNASSSIPFLQQSHRKLSHNPPSLHTSISSLNQHSGFPDNEEDEDLTVKSPPNRRPPPPRLELDVRETSSAPASPSRRPTRPSARDSSGAPAAVTPPSARSRGRSPYAHSPVKNRSSSVTLPTPSADARHRALSPYLPTPATSGPSSSSPYCLTPSTSRCPSPYLTAPTTPRPTLLFALASDDPQRVARALLPEPGSKDQDGPTPNDLVPTEQGVETPALEYIFQSSEKLVNWRGMVAVLLGFGASPSPHSLEDCSMVMRYYLHLALQDSTAELLNLILKSKIFPALGRLRFEVIGQQRAFENLFRGFRRWEVTKERDRGHKKGGKPIVAMFCGLSAHGKTHMAQQVAEVLGLPSFTVDMASVQSTTDIWNCQSTTDDDEEKPDTLAVFLERNRGRRSVIILDEIDKTSSESALWALLKPWESGKCSVSPTKMIDVRNTIFIATSNIGQSICSTLDPEIPTEQEYDDIIKACRMELIECLGASVESRIPIVLPFLPFTDDEKIAIAGDALTTLSAAGPAVMADSVEDDLLRALEDETLVSGDARELWRVAERFTVDL